MRSAKDLILGISSIHGYAHDNSAALLQNGKILFAASEERYSRVKHDGSFPERTIKNGLAFLKLKPSSIKRVAVGYPKRKNLSVLYNKYFYEIFSFGFSLLVKRKLWLFKDALVVANLLLGKGRLTYKQSFLKKKKIVYVDHHLAHSASAYYTSGFEKCISVVLDAFGSNLSGEIRSGAVFLCDRGEMGEVLSTPFYASLGNFYQSVTYSLGFKPGDGEGKTMGLAAYGSAGKLYRFLRPYAPRFKEGNWIPGVDWLAGVVPSMPKVAYLFDSTKFGRLLEDLKKKYKKEDIAAAAQRILEEEVINLVRYLLKTYPDYRDVCLSGGIFLNVKTNKKIMELPRVEGVFVHPNAGDGGVALGAALVATEKRYLKRLISKPLVSCGLGESFSDKEVLSKLKENKDKVIYRKVGELPSYVADRLIEGKVLGWFQGRAEWGPRALGYRSVLADPRDIRVKDRINEVLKNRDWFMPFAPSILEEEGPSYLKDFRPSPFMTIAFDVLPDKEKLFSAALHIDNTARPNSVNRENNELYYLVLKSFFKKSGLPILLNTSFNKHGLPIVNSPEDAIDHLLMGAVDELIIGKYAATRRRS